MSIHTQITADSWAKLLSQHAETPRPDRKILFQNCTLDEHQILDISQAKTNDQNSPTTRQKLINAFQAFANYQNELHTKLQPAPHSFAVRFSRFANNHSTLSKIFTILSGGLYHLVFKWCESLILRADNVKNKALLFQELANKLKLQLQIQEQQADKQSTQTLETETSHKNEEIDVTSASEVSNRTTHCVEELNLDVTGLILSYLDTKDRKRALESNICVEAMKKMEGSKWKMAQSYQKRLLSFFCKNSHDFTDEIRQIKLLKNHLLDIDELMRLELSVKNQETHILNKIAQLLKLTYPLNPLKKILDLMKDWDFTLLILTIEPNMLRFASAEFRQDKNLVLNAIKRSWSCFEFASAVLQNDKEFVIEALKSTRNEMQFSAIPEELLKDKEVLLAGVRNHLGFSSYIPESFKDDIDIILNAILCDYGPMSLQRVSQDVLAKMLITLAKINGCGYWAFRGLNGRNSLPKEAALLAVQDEDNDPSILGLLPPELCDDEEIVLAAVRKSCDFAPVSLRLREKESIVLEALKVNGDRLEHVGPSLNTRKDIVYSAVSNSGQALRFAPTFNDDEELVLIAVSQDGHALQFASDRCKDIKKIVLAAIKNKASSFMYASRSLRNNREVALASVEQDGEMFEFISAELQEDPEIVLIASKHVGDHFSSFYCYIPDELTSNKDFILKLLKVNVKFFSIISDAFRNDPEVVKTAVMLNASIFKDASENIKDNEEIVLEVVQKDGRQLTHASTRLKDKLQIVKAAIQNNPIAFDHASPAMQTHPEVLETLEITVQRIYNGN